jgi:hypothetical protein
MLVQPSQVVPANAAAAAGRPATAAAAPLSTHAFIDSNSKQMMYARGGGRFSPHPPSADEAMDDANTPAAAANFYLNLERIDKFYKEAPNAFRNLHREAIRKAESLEKFTATCAKNNSSLPLSLQLHFAEKINFPTVDPARYTAEREQLRALQAETSKKIYDILLAVKKKEIAHLNEQATPATFVTTTAAEFAKVVTDDAARYARAPALPVDAATLHVESIVSNFKQFLTTDTMQYMRSYAEVAREKQIAAEKQRTDNLAAQAEVLGGSAAASISAIVAKKVAEQTADLQRQLKQLKENALKRKEPPATTANTNAPASTNTFQLHPVFFQTPSVHHLNRSGGDRHKKQKRSSRNDDSGQDQ